MHEFCELIRSLRIFVDSKLVYYLYCDNQNQPCKSPDKDNNVLRSRTIWQFEFYTSFVADLCIKYLRPPKHNQSEDHLYLLYHILSYMPLTNVRSVFKANNLDLLIQIIEKELKTSQKDELALIAQKILDFPNSNFLSGKQI